MGCCCCCDGEPDDDDDVNPGPDVKRHCTNFFCLIIMVLCMAVHLALLYQMDIRRSTQVLTHGHDHYHNLCGIGSMESKRYVYYPDLQTDFRKDPALKQRYGVCVESCPQQRDMVADYDGQGGEPMRRPEKARWFVSLPSFKFSGRCIPYEPLPTEHGVELCAYPPCTEIEGGVCGIKDDDPPTDTYWLLTKPDKSVTDAWLAADISQEEIDKRTAQAPEANSEIRKKCEVIVHRSTSIGMKPADDSFLMKVLTKYTGLLFRWCKAIYKQRLIVFGLGVGGALIASFIVVCALTCFARCVVLCLLVVLFIVLIFADFLLFQQAGVVSGSGALHAIAAFEKRTELDVPDDFEELLKRETQDERMLLVCKWSGVILTILIPLLACGVCVCWKNFEKLIALLKEASRTLREMPSLLIFPFLLLPCMVVTSLVFMAILLGLATSEAADVEPLLQYWITYIQPIYLFLGAQDEDPFTQARTSVIWVVIFCFLWAYFIHVALFIMVVAIAVSHWYFYRDDPERSAGTGVNSAGYFFGRPALLAIWRVCRYHLGSVAMGSFIMALATMPRIVLEYVVKQTHADENPVGKAIVWVVRCMLWCLQKCLQFLTEYAYVHVAVSGKGFCAAARASFALIAKYPLQVALDKMAGTAIGVLTCASVPVGMAVTSFYILYEEQAACGMFILGLAYITTRMTVGVYDICVTTLFVCVMRDSEYYGGRYAPDGLRIVCDVREVKAAVQLRPRGSREDEGTEMKERQEQLSAPLAVHHW